jgi:DNA polymerase sigma
LDLVIFGVDDSTVANLQDLAHALIKAELVFNNEIEVISKARVPILKLTDKLGQYSLDVSFKLENGIRAAERMHQLQRDTPALRLVLVHKL